jgi:hypothetical protein
MLDYSLEDIFDDRIDILWSELGRILTKYDITIYTCDNELKDFLKIYLDLKEKWNMISHQDKLTIDEILTNIEVLLKEEGLV